MHISSYAVDYSLLALSGISPSVHLMELSRGCSFRCSFCVIPQEVGGHVKYSLSHLSAAIDNALATSPFFSFRRWYPTIIFLDNNFSDDREHASGVRTHAQAPEDPRLGGACDSKYHA